MNKLLTIVRYLTISLALFAISQTSVFAHVSTYSEQNFKSKGNRPEVELIKSRLNNLAGSIDIAYSPEVHSRIIQYTVKHRVYTEKLLGKASIYFPIIEEVLREKNLPQELKYIPVVESLLDPKARSKAGAFGLWQFISSTGKMYNLDQDKLVDHRADPRQATEAALTYLADMYEEFGYWTLVMAAYNCGPGTIRSAIRRSGKSDYWSLRSYLPRETQKYIPRIIAAAYLMNYYHNHNLNPAGMDEVYQQTSLIHHEHNLSLTDLSNSLNIDIEQLQALNPMYLTDSVVMGENNFLRLPSNRLYQYYAIYEPTKFDEQYSAASHGSQRTIIKIDSMEHLEKIVAYFDMSANTL